MKEDHRATWFHEARRPEAYLFEPGNHPASAALRTAYVHLPEESDVLDVVRREVDRAWVDNGQRPIAIILGSRWYAALRREAVDTLSETRHIDIWVDSQMERGCRLVLGPERAFQRWVSKHCDLQHRTDTTPIRELAQQALTDDASLEILADWYESQGDTTSAEALRNSRRGFQVLASILERP